MKEYPLRSHALRIEKITKDGITRFKYQHSPVFTNIRDCVEWIKDHLDELEDIENAS